MSIAYTKQRSKNSLFKPVIKCCEKISRRTFGRKNSNTYLHECTLQSMFRIDKQNKPVVYLTVVL